MGKNTVQLNQWLHKLYWDSGRPKSAVVEVNITKVRKIVLGDRKLKLCEIAKTLKISEGSVFTILHESLGMRKVLKTKNTVGTLL